MAVRGDTRHLLECGRPQAAGAQAATQTTTQTATQPAATGAESGAGDRGLFPT